MRLNQAIGANRDQKNRADKRVALKKSAIDPGDIKMAGAAMFINERGRNQAHGAVINGTEFCGHPKSD